MFNKFLNKLIEKKTRLLEIFNKKQWAILIVLLILSIVIGN